MNIRNCQNCKQNFTIEAEDIAFYEKIQVPRPTFCPECRLIRRLAWRNDHVLFKRKSDWSGEMIFSMFSEKSPVKVYESPKWWSDDWDCLKSGREYDFNRPFFEQFRDIMLETPLLATSTLNGINSDYCNNFNDIKNCYLVFGSNLTEDSCYSNRIWNSKNCVDVHYMVKGELCYESCNIHNGYKIYYSENCESVNDIYFSRDLVGCSSCFGCANLRNKKYYYFNTSLTKEEYEAKLKEANLGSRKNIEHWKKAAEKLWVQHPVRYMHGRQNENASGDYVYNSKNIYHSFNVREGENLRYCFSIEETPLKDCMDYSIFGQNAQNVYETMTCGIGVSDIRWCSEVWKDVRDAAYSMLCTSSNYLFGCVGVRKKQYCILNKEHSKEEYETLVPKIIQHMNEMPYRDKKGRVYKYGEFFPIELSPFTYNDSLAQDYFPSTKEEVEKQGYEWRNIEKKNYNIAIQEAEIPDQIESVKNEIIGQNIECAHKGMCNDQCPGAFRIIPQELEFYKNMNVPLPNLCPNCRYFKRQKRRTPLRLWKRSCDCATSSHNHENAKCLNEFKTAYALDRPEIIYCNECYQAEIV